MKHNMKAGLVVVCTCIAAGCSSTNSPSSDASGEKAAAKPPEPVTIKLYPGQWITDADMDLMINGPLKKKYPHITVERLNRDKNPLAEHVARGDEVDLITSWNGSMSENMYLKIYEDLTPLAKPINFSLDKFDAQAIDTVRAISDDGKLYGLPYNRQFNALYYNKDIFDKFGVAYPKDGMTWDDSIELAKRLTRQDSGTQYRGLDPENITRMGYQLSLVQVDAKTNTSDIVKNMSLYQKLFETGNRIFSIPGNKPAKWGYSAYDAFIKDRTVAMSANINYFPYLAEAPDFTNWDLVQYPSYPDKPNVYGIFDMHIIGISNTSKHKDDAMKVLEVLFSDEVQLIATKQTGRISLLSDTKYQQAYGAEMPILKGKNIQSIFKSKPAPVARLSKYYGNGGTNVRNKFNDFVDGKVDMNTAIREAEELTNAYIKTQEGK
ncbi:MAG: family 1 extracellular solute-binding protein [Paenibacillus sp.]|nr:family 1 extracellular solute-binding protein [Paenibacillus sp.]